LRPSLAVSHRMYCIRLGCVSLLPCGRPSVPCALLPEVDPCNQGDQKAGRESQYRYEWRTQDLRDGSINQQKGCQGDDDNKASQNQHVRTEVGNRMAPGPQAGQRSRQWKMCRYGRSQSEEGTTEEVTSQWHQVQVESMQGLAEAGV
jgi:hypothetical protein